MCEKGYYSSNQQPRLVESLKEWATVVKALESGDQTVILRKGGILETASGFRIESKKFLLFPTYEHQELKHIKSEHQYYLEEMKNEIPKEGFNDITSVAVVLDEKDVSSQEVIDALSPFHIWSQDYIKARQNWMSEKPLKAVFLKIYKIPKFEIPIKSEYQGCKSWIDINANIEAGEAVLGEAELNSRLEKFKEIVN